MYLLFAGDDYYPCGGFGDFIGEFHTVKDALKCAAKLGKDWYQIVDVNDNWKIVERSD